MLFKKKPIKEPITCNHIFQKYVRMYDCKRMCNTFYLICELCGEKTTINFSDGMLTDLFSDISEHSIRSR